MAVCPPLMNTPPALMSLGRYGSSTLATNCRRVRICRRYRQHFVARRHSVASVDCGRRFSELGHACQAASARGDDVSSALSWRHSVSISISRHGSSDNYCIARPHHL